MALVVHVSPVHAQAIPRRTFLNRLLDTRRDHGLLVARVTLGSVMLIHGAQKLLGWFGGPGMEGALAGFSSHFGIPRPLGVLVILAEFLGGLGLIAGCFGRLAAAGIAAVMAGAVVLVHARNGFFMNWSGTQAGEGFEYHLLAIGMALAIVLRGSGAWSIDRRLRHRIR